MILDPTDQRIRDEGFNFVPFDRYLASPFQMPESQTVASPVSTGITTLPMNMGEGRGGTYTGGVNDLITDYDKITIATLGNGVDAGDLSLTRTSFASMSSRTRAVFGGGYLPASPNAAQNTLDYQQFASTSNFIDFGDLSTNFRNTAGLSNGHGGLG